MLGTRVGNYSITGKLATGGMGEVYLARHDLMQRDAVVKVLRPEMSVNTEMVQRFFNEARAAAAIQHPGIVDVYDMGYADDGRAFLVMEKLRGESLAERLGKTRVSTARAVSYVRQLAGALGAAHERGIVHRDLKPDNLFVVPDPDVVGGERIKVLDFGIAKLAMEKSGSLVTAAGAVFGTPAYMAPEQCTSTATVDLRADLYAVGCIFYELLCGRPPFGHGGVELFAAHLRDEPARLRAADESIPVELESIVMRLLSKKPEDRFQSCGQLLTALDACPSCGQLSTPPGTDLESGATLPNPEGNQALVPTPSQLGSAATMPATGRDAGRVVERPGQNEPTAPLASGAPQTAPYPQPEAAQPMTTQTSSSGETLSRAHRGRGGLWAAVAVVAVVGVGSAVFAVSRMGGNDGPAISRDEDRHRASRRERDGDRTREGRVDRLLGEGMRALAAEDWATAVGKASQVLAIEQGNAAALDLQARAEGEIENRGVFRKLEDAFAGKHAEDVARLYGEIPEVSVYREKATPLYIETRDAWVAPRLEEARALAEKRRCKKIEPIEEQIVALFPEAGPEVHELANSCRPRAATRPPKQPAGDKAQGTPDEPKPPKPTPAELLGEARIALRNGEAGKALRLCEEALGGGKGDENAISVCAMAACNLRNQDKAAAMLGRLEDPNRRRMVLRICRRSGVRLNDPAAAHPPGGGEPQQPRPGQMGKLPGTGDTDDITLE